MNIITKQGKVTVAVSYMPPKIRSWKNQEYLELITNPVKSNQFITKVEDKSNNDWENLEVKTTENQ